MNIFMNSGFKIKEIIIKNRTIVNQQNIGRKFVLKKFYLIDMNIHLHLLKFIGRLRFIVSKLL